MSEAADESTAGPDTRASEEPVLAQVIRPAPITPHERIEVVDILRGFAIFGILAVNLLWFAHPFYIDGAGIQPGSGPVDRVARWLINFLFLGKFYSLFSFLFGFGMAVQMARAEARGAPFVRLYGRRLCVLLGIGLCHAVFLWAGDILVSYAILGFVLLLFRRCRPGTLIVWALACLFVPVLSTTGCIGINKLALSLKPTAMATAAPTTTPATSTAPTTASATAPTTGRVSAPGTGQGYLATRVRQAYDTYRHGTYGQILGQRVEDWLFLLVIAVLVTYGSILAMFLFGLYAGRRGILHDVTPHLGFIRKLALWGLALGVVGNLIMVVASELAHPGQVSWFALVPLAAGTVGAPALCFFYASVIVLVVQKDAWRRRLRPLAAVGRMALTNYLLQSVICTMIFNGYGFGQFGKVGPALGFLLTVVIYNAQIPFSVLWLRRFRFGPMEWLWRSLTYGKAQPMRPSG
jgi:uncharacterized protein